MATTWRGRSFSSSRPSFGGFSSFSTQDRWGRSSSIRRNTAGKRTSSSPSQNAYKSVFNQFQWKIDSYKTLSAQAQGQGKFDRPSPAILNSFAKWIEKGAVIQTVSTAQLSRWARIRNRSFSPRNPSLAACKSVLVARFGKSVIKAVARTKSGSFMVATPATWQGRPFSFAR